MEADTYATVTLLDAYFGTAPRAKPRLSVDLPFLGACEDRPSKVLTLALTAILGVVKLFGTPLPEYAKWDQLDHPPDEVRRFAILMYAQLHLQKWGQVDLANQWEAIKEVVTAIDKTLHGILGDAPPTEEYRQKGRPGGEFELHAIKISELRRRMNPQFSTLAYCTTNVLP